VTAEAGLPGGPTALGRRRRRIRSCSAAPGRCRDDHDRIRAFDGALEFPAAARDKQERSTAPAPGWSGMRLRHCPVLPAYDQATLQQMPHHGDAFCLLQSFSGMPVTGATMIRGISPPRWSSGSLLAWPVRRSPEWAKLTTRCSTDPKLVHATRFLAASRQLRLLLTSLPGMRAIPTLARSLFGA
jgi:hypothetical protein